MISKSELDKLVLKYETEDFINPDPVRFTHLYHTKTDKELAGFISSLFAYGNRKLFISKLEQIFKKAGNNLTDYIKAGDFKNLEGIEYRFSKDIDIINMFKILSSLYNKSRGLEELFEYGYKTYPRIDLHEEKYDKFLQVVVDYFYSNAPKGAGQGFYHMIPEPQKGGAMKRMNMFLRWMIRKSAVDPGLWNFMKPKDLLIPLDVHVSRLSRQMGLLNRKSNDFKAVVELTDNLKIYSQDDPVKYDFAMFAFGVELNSKKVGV